MSDGTMIEMVDFEELQKQKEQEAAEAQALRKAEQEAEYARFEQLIARDLYDRADVKKAGQEALSKVSTLLIRYNRLKDAETRRRMDSIDKEYRSKARLDKKLKEIEEKRKKLAILDDDEQKRKALDQLAQEEKDAKSMYDEEIRELQLKSEERYVAGLASSIDDDSAGGILTSLMLGGNATGSTGYVITTGDAGDLMKGSDYIHEMTGENGTFLTQMAFLDNAVNTEGIDLNQKDDEYKLWGLTNKTVEDEYIGSSATGATYSLGDVLRNITQEDVTEINRFTGSNMKIDMEAISSEREYGGLDDTIGIQVGKKTINEAKKERGISKEAKQRIEGKTGGVNDWDKETKKFLIEAAKPRDQFPGIFGSMFRPKPESMKAKKGAERRRALREARKAWQDELKKVSEYRNDSGLKFRENKKDTAENVFSAIEKPAEKPVAEKNSKKKENEKALSDAEVKALEAASASKSKSARNMIAAYRLLGASPQELYMFRLALIAYMVPTGKKTLMEILKESEEAGYVGNEDLSSPENMYATFLNEPVVDGAYINRSERKKVKKQNEKEKLKAMNTADKEKMLKALSTQEAQEKSPEKKEEAKKKLADKWAAAASNSIEEVNEEESEDEEVKAVEEVKEEIKEEEKKEEQEETVLEKALNQHFKIVGKTIPEEDILNTFLDVFEKDQQVEQFGNVLLPQELEEIKNKLANEISYENEIRDTIQKLLDVEKSE